MVDVSGRKKTGYGTTSRNHISRRYLFPTNNKFPEWNIWPKYLISRKDIIPNLYFPESQSRIPFSRRDIIPNLYFPEEILSRIPIFQKGYYPESPLSRRDIIPNLYFPEGILSRIPIFSKEHYHFQKDINEILLTYFCM